MTAACPACAGVEMARPAPALETTHLLHLPDIHCGACIAGVERALGAAPGVRAARVNLTRKRVAITAPGLDAATLVAALAEAGYRAQPMDAARTGADRTPRDLLTRIGVAGFAMMNVMLLSVAVWSGATGATAQVFHLVSAAIAIPAVAYAAQPFFGSALQALRARRLNMDVPIALAILLASLASLAAAFDLAPNDGWFDAALALTFFLLIGRYLDTAGRAAARSAAADLAALDVPQAIRLEDGRERVVPAADLAPGDLILLRPGDRLPADGEIVSGRCDLDRSALTGESQPAPAGPGDPVAAGETCLTGALTVRVLRAGRDTALARMAETIAAAEGQRTRYAGLADRAARLYAPAVHLLGAGTFLGWLAATGDGWRALDVAISVLVITCPCALGLAVPAVSTVATGRLFRAGLLVKSPTALERLSEVDIVAFDKTGTLTTGTPRLAVRPDDAALAAAAGLARHSAHPMSRAIVAAAEAAGLAPAPVRDIAEHPGDGVEGWLDGRRLRLGRAAFAGGAGDGLWLGRDGTAPVALPMAETLRPGAAPATAALAAAGYGTALLSGDAAGPVRRLAAETGIAEAHADLRPADKTAWVEARQDEGHRVLMVGDGLNDTGPLAVAHAGLSPGSALDAARSASDVVALSGDVGAVPLLLRTARGAMARMRQNIGLALAYNAISIPLAVTGHASPLVAALAMSASSLTVTLNAMRRL